jgi:hypothetical protein
VLSTSHCDVSGICMAAALSRVAEGGCGRHEKRSSWGNVKPMPPSESIVLKIGMTSFSAIEKITVAEREDSRHQAAGTGEISPLNVPFHRGLFPPGVPLIRAAVGLVERVG